MNSYFKVTKDSIGRYRISIGIGKTYSAKDIEEVHTALNHYYGNNSCRLGNNSDCLLCRAIKKEAENIRKPRR